MPLDLNGARAAITSQIAEPMGIPVEEAAWGIHATVNENMANAARVHAVERGQDVSRLPLFASGGNGPLHGPGVARVLGSPTVIVPPAAGVLSALGLLSAPMSIDLVRSSHAELDGLELDRALGWLDELRVEGESVLTGSGVTVDEIDHEHTLDMRFIGQGAEIQVPVPAGGDDWSERVREAFLEQYEQRYGAAAPHQVGVEILTWRVTSRGRDPGAQLRFASVDDDRGSLKGHRDIYFPETGAIPTPVHDRYRVSPGTVLEGPAVVEETESTLVIPPGSRCTVRDDGSILLKFDREGDR
jgi:N-methylhydantoinase A